MPTDTTVVSPAQDEESDENISLDLHVSDTEEAEGTEDVVADKNDEEIPMEIEDDILNKFEIKETLRQCDILGPDEPEEPEESEVPEEPDENNKNEAEGAEEKENSKDANEEQVIPEENIMEEKAEETKVEESTEEKPTPAEVKKIEDKGEKKTTDKTDEPGKEEVKTTEEPEKETEGDNEDLLAIMEEKTTEADETEFENDIEEEAKSEEKNENGEEHSGNNTDENQSDSEGQSQEKDEKAASPTTEETEENVDTTMDIEENDVHTESNDINHEEDENVVKEEDISQEDLDVTVIENKVAEPENSEDSVKGDENKENMETNVHESGKSVLESILTGKSVEGKSNKRLLSDESSGDESAKKIKLIKKDKEPEKPQDTTVTKLNSFKKFMLDKSLKGITRDQLEVFCIQKMCECIVQKSEIGELKVKVKMQEQMLDCLRKEVVNVSKQARDLNIVHQKVMQDVSRLQENNDKPLIVPKITRSVGLQAVVRVEENKRKTPRPATVIQSKMVPIRPKPAPPVTPGVIRNATNVGQKQNTTPTTPTTRGVNKPANTTSTPNTPKSVPKAAEVNGKGAGVIDLTDEDDKKPVANNSPVPNGTKVNMINAPNGHKFVLMPNGQTVMVKLATPTTGNVVVTQPLIRTAASPTTNGTIRNNNSVLRTVTQPVRTVTANPLRGRAPLPNIAPRQTRPMYRPPQVQKILRHPAALPNAAPISIEGAKPIPPKPHLMLNKTNCGTGIVLSWKMPYKLDLYEKIASYQLYAYQETKSEPKTENWGKIGDVKALELPMAVTLTHFAVGNRYFFAVRAVDNLSRPGEFSHYETILL